MIARSTSRSRASCCCACGSHDTRLARLIFFLMVCTGTKIKNFFMVILIPKLSLNCRTSWWVRELHIESSNYSSTTTYIGHTGAELNLTRHTAYCIAAPRRDFEADSAAPWQRAPPLDHMQVAAVRAAWHQWWLSLRAPGGETPHRPMLLTTWCLYC